MQTDRSCVELFRFVARGHRMRKQSRPRWLSDLILSYGEHGVTRFVTCLTNGRVLPGVAAWRMVPARDGSCAGWSGAEAGHGEGRSGLRRGTSPRSGEWLGGLLGGESDRCGGGGRGTDQPSVYQGGLQGPCMIRHQLARTAWPMWRRRPWQTGQQGWGAADGAAGSG